MSFTPSRRQYLTQPSQGTIEEKATISLTAGKSVDLLVEYTNTAPLDGDDEKGEGRLSQPALMRGVVSI
jgi:beta-glucosidase